MSRILVLGATGALGRPLVRRLAEAGHKVVAAGHTGRGLGDLAKLGAHVLTVDALSKESVESAVNVAAPDVVVNLLSRQPHRLRARNPDADFEDHINLRLLSPKILMDALAKLRPQRVVASSNYYACAGMRYLCLSPGKEGAPDTGAITDLGLNESFPGEYSDAKRHYDPTIVPSTNVSVRNDELPDVDSPIPFLRAFNMCTYRFERMHLAYKHGEGVVLRMGYLYGPGTTFGREGVMRSLAMQGRLHVVGEGKGQWSFTHVEDAADALYRAATSSGPAGTYNVVHPEAAATHLWIPSYCRHMTGGAGSVKRLPPGIIKWYAPHIHFVSCLQRAATHEGFPEAYSWKPSHPPMWECLD